MATNMRTGIQVRDEGDHPIGMDVKDVTREQAFVLLQQQGKVFTLAGVEWDAEANVAKIRFDPGNGVAWVHKLEEINEW